ncbi:MULTISPECIES: ESPR-type extended signal peptide-containing protein [Paraburkholderia]|uniref:ESPR domain-containing protein n=1 Tax=Paraburkholderia madseniana TaxID=2599607 RepID=A0A6N6W5J3_9BURK|nr:hypothetical protein FSO04_31645 [Paraburkholderia madseniana]
MNNRAYRLVYSKPRGMLVAVAETATRARRSTMGHKLARMEQDISPVRALTVWSITPTLIRITRARRRCIGVRILRCSSVGRS